jgi:hypothetical protein
MRNREIDHAEMIGPIRQDQDYHRFADGRALLGIENAADVLSSLAFVLAGVLGLVFLWRNRGSSTRFSAAEETRAYWALFCAIALAGLGSMYYHLAPDDARLAWDRGPIAVAFMCLLAAVIAERVDVKAGVKLLVPLVVLGAVSVLYWVAFDDLRPYGLVQFGVLAAVLVLAALFPSRYSKGEALWAAAALYGVAKLFELQDRQIYELTGHWVSGHTLKHLTAAAALCAILWSLERRSLRDALVSRPSSSRPIR